MSSSATGWAVMALATYMQGAICVAIFAKRYVQPYVKNNCNVIFTIKAASAVSIALSTFKEDL